MNTRLNAHSAPLRVYLLQSQPLVTLNDEPVDISGQPLDLFIYLADSREATYARNDVLDALYDDAAPMRLLRQGALYNLPAILKAQYVDSNDQATIRVAHQSIWVDSREFMERANALLSHSPLNNEQQIQEAQQILALYRSHFLQNHFSSLAKFPDWQERRQTQLAELRHSLFDQIIQFYLCGARLEEAQLYAQLWSESLEPGDLPLQYLIWITANRRQYDALKRYLNALRTIEREQESLSPIGLSSAEWQKALQKYEQLPPALLRLTPVHTNPLLPQVINAHQLTGQERPLREIAQVLSERPEAKVMALTGLPGVGKTTIAHMVAPMLQKMNLNYEVIFLQLRPEPDFESLLGSILEQIGLKHEATYNLARKQRSVRQLLQKRRCLIIIDEGNTRKLSDTTFVQTLLGTLNDAHLLLVGQQLSDESYIPIAVEGLTATAVQDFFSEHFPEIGALSLTAATEIAAITGGLPLGLKLLIGFLRDERFQLNTFIKALEPATPEPWQFDNIQNRYDDILTWVWPTLTTAEKLVLHSVGLFDATNGATAEDIAIICGDVHVGKIKARIEKLGKLALLREQPHPEQVDHYSLHSLVANFIQHQARFLPDVQPDLDRLEDAYAAHILDYVRTHRTQFPLLDRQRENILHLFELVLINRQHPELCRDALAALPLIYPYFEKRGLHAIAANLINKALEIDSLQTMPEEHIQLLHHAGQAAYKRSNQELAQNYLNEARELAESVSASQFYGAIHLDMALLRMQNGEFNEAMASFAEAHRWAQLHHQRQLLCRIAANSGVCSNREGKYAEGKLRFEQVWEFLTEEEKQNVPDELNDILQVVYNGLALITLEDNDYQRTDDCYQEALTLARKLNNPERIGYLYVNMGVAAYFSRAFDAAYEYFLQAKIIAENIQHDELVTLVHWNQGALYSAQMKYEPAAGLLMAALLQATELGLVWMQAGICIALGLLYFRQESLLKAEQAFRMALVNAGNNSKFLSQALYGLALIEISTKDILGKNDVQCAIEQIDAMLTRLGIDRERLSKLTYKELERTDKVFRHDLDKHPQLPRYRIVDGLWGVARKSTNS